MSNAGKVEAKELRIGNLVVSTVGISAGRSFGDASITKEVIAIKAVDIVACEQYPDFFEYIPLTEEWLVKLGFEKEGVAFIIAGVDNCKLIIEYDLTFCYGYDYECSGSGMKLKYVHQLQNLFFALTGAELEVK